MTIQDKQYFIQSSIKKPAVHHQSFQKLWDTKWKKPAEMGVYPFMFGTARDFEPIVAEIIQKRIQEPYDNDTYAETYFPKAEELESIARLAEETGEMEKASEYYLRSSAVYRMARFPVPRSKKQRYAWDMCKKTAFKGLRLREHSINEVLIPHTHALVNSVEENSTIPVLYHLPAQASQASPVPLVMIITGLDGYRTELAVWIEGWRRNGVGVLVVEIPGTGDSPAIPGDPQSPDRLWSSVLDWIGTQQGVDQGRICVWGFSTGGFYSIRLAHTHAKRVKGVVALGGGCHYMFDPEWLDEVNHLEYPTRLADTLAFKFGYGDDVGKFKREASDKFSLLKDGTLDRPECARLLLVNGTEDEIFPIDDCYLALEHGAAKEARFIPRKKHMGEPESFVIILEWIYKLFGIDADALKQLATLPFKPKY